ncbi:MAG TPA: glycosyltransferase N-terminal domain-containing protein [Candidatus Krumholzibacteria bacterium]|nr:glycosyltransferase N-terminal domain-containing protein [Candidatus Krumholzibacteria bacterium]HRX50227.1 glycosyltransferase N-terminal domain-containing protein [Candidatus Krumholzibacteria bacterium]
MDWGDVSLGLYRGLSPALARASAVSARFSAKWRRGLEGRRGLDDRLREQSPRLRGCLWFHASSVGEYEQARPVLAALRARGVGPLAVTHYSSSGYDFAQTHPEADVHEYLPLDTPAAMARLVDAWRPRLLAFAKYDCWPNQVRAARRAGVPVVLIAGSLPPGSPRLWPLARPALRRLHDGFARLGVGHEADRRRFVETLGVRAPVVVTGDTRAEQVLRRFEASREGPVAAALRAWGGRPLVLGSTWPPDERLWWRALPELLSAHPDLKIVAVPHEPTDAHLAPIAQALDGLGLAPVRLSAFRGAGDPARAVVVDRVGVLAEIYAAGALAYVGGAFTTGVHSTLEPAAAGLPVLFGPRIHNAEEAHALIDADAGRVVRTPEEARAAAHAWLHDDAARAHAAAAARAVVDAQRGATERTVAMILEVLAEGAQAR